MAITFNAILAFLGVLASPTTVTLVRRLATTSVNTLEVWRAIHDNAGTDAIDAALQKLLDGVTG